MPPLALEGHLQSQLNHAWAATTQARIGLCDVRGLGDKTLLRGTRAHKEVRQGKVWVIENIKELDPKLKTRPFNDPSIL
jgi:hypothetical protein